MISYFFLPKLKTVQDCLLNRTINDFLPPTDKNLHDIVPIWTHSAIFDAYIEKYTNYFSPATCAQQLSSLKKRFNGTTTGPLYHRIFEATCPKVQQFMSSGFCPPSDPVINTTSTSPMTQAAPSLLTRVLGFASENKGTIAAVAVTALVGALAYKALSNNSQKTGKASEGNSLTARVSALVNKVISSVKSPF